MTQVVRTNVAAMYSQNALKNNARSTAIAMNRLSTGVRVNQAKDDAAGLAIGQNMTSQIRGLNQAIHNINDGINLVQTAEGGLNSISNMLQRMRELAVQAANITYSNTQRQYLNTECQQLQSAIGQVIGSTMWNDQILLDGNFSKPIQIGSNGNEDMQVVIPSANMEDLGIGNSAGRQLTKIKLNVPPNPSPVIHQTENYIEYTDMGTNGENLSFTKVTTPSSTNDAVSIVGSAVYLGNGFTAQQIGSVDSQYDGMNGKALRINLKPQFPNGNFDTGSAGSSIIAGWTALNQRIRLDGTSIVAGWPTPMDATTAPGGGIESAGGAGSFNTVLSSVTSTGAGLAVELNSSLNGVSNNPPNVGGVLHGPVLVSDSSITLNAGDTVAFDWQASGGADAFDVYAYLLNTQTGNTEEILNVTGASAQDVRPWTNVIHTVTNSGDYKFVFSSGSWDATGGQAAGAKLLIDNVVVNASVSPNLTNTQIGNITNLVQYNNSTPLSASVIIDGFVITSSPSSTINDCTSNLEAAIQTEIANGNLKGLNVVTAGNEITLTSEDPGRGFTVLSDGNNNSKLVSLDIENSQPLSATIDISSMEFAGSALTALDFAINAVNASRATLGSYINRLAYSADNATNIWSNTTQSRSSIIDTDYALETTILARNQIIQQASMAMLAQANAQPQAVMVLLKNQSV